MLLVGGFYATAVLLAIVGVYGVLSSAVGQRRQEFGIRLALGAKRTDILQMVMRQGIVLVVGGIMSGLCVALMLTRLLGIVLYKTTSRDLTTFVLVRRCFFWWQCLPLIFRHGVR